MFNPRAQSFGAIYEGARILNEFREKLVEPGLSFSPGVVLGGTNVEYDQAQATGNAFGKTNVIPRLFVAHSDMRFLTTEQAERARKGMREIASKNLPGTQAELRFRTGYPPMPPSEGNRRLAALYSRASEDAGYGPVGLVDPADRGAGDVQFSAPHVPGIDGLGPAGRGSHSVDEEMDIPSLERSTVRAALIIHRLTREPRGSAPR
jgi:glutamate carboxypeptidase